MTYTCLILLRRAISSLLLLWAVTLPMPTFSRITLEAYKKYILVSVIHHGQFSTSLPQYIPKDARWGLISLSEPYHDLVRSYDSGKVSELETCVQKNKVMFESDKNLGLVKQVVTSMYKHNIQKLTKIYLTLSLQDIANTVGLNTPKEAETYVLHMIQEGQIYATIDQRDSMVRFLENSEQYNMDLEIRRMEKPKLNLINMKEYISFLYQYISEDDDEWVKSLPDPCENEENNAIQDNLQNDVEINVGAELVEEVGNEINVGAKEVVEEGNAINVGAEEVGNEVNVGAQGNLQPWFRL